MKRTLLLALVMGCLLGSGCASRDGMGVLYGTVEVYVDEERDEALDTFVAGLQEELLGQDPAALTAATQAAFAERDPWADGGPVAWEGLHVRVRKEPVEYDKALLGTGSMSGPNGFFGPELPDLPDGVTCDAYVAFGVTRRKQGPGFAGYPSSLAIQVFMLYHESVGYAYRQCFVLNEVVFEELLKRLRARLDAAGFAARLFRGGREL